MRWEHIAIGLLLCVAVGAIAVARRRGRALRLADERWDAAARILAELTARTGVHLDPAVIEQPPRRRHLRALPPVAALIAAGHWVRQTAQDRPAMSAAVIASAIAGAIVAVWLTPGDAPTESAPALPTPVPSSPSTAVISPSAPVPPSALDHHRGALPMAVGATPATTRTPARTPGPGTTPSPVFSPALIPGPTGAPTGTAGPTTPPPTGTARPTTPPPTATRTPPPEPTPTTTRTPTPSEPPSDPVCTLARELDPPAQSALAIEILCRDGETGEVCVLALSLDPPGETRLQLEVLCPREGHDD